MAAKRSRSADLYLVGRGIADGISQMTVEGLEALKRSRVVFDLSGDARAIRKVHPNVIDLAREYWTGERLDNVHVRLQKRIFDEVENNGPVVSVVVDGHPMFFDDMNWNLVRKGRRRGLRVVPLAGICCVDTMTIDLEIDIGDGTQVVEANHLVTHDLTLNPYLQTFVFQVAKFGTRFASAETSRNLPGRFTPLVKHLTRFYPPDHMATLLVSGGNAKPLRKRIRLGRLDDARAFLHRHQDEGMTMHIPPCPRDPVNEAFDRALDDEAHLEKIAVLAKISS